MKKLLLVTGPQGSGNHMFSKLLALHPAVYGWKALNETYWIGHDQEPFNKFWADSSLWATTDFGNYQYAFASISVPYVQNGVTVVPDFKRFIAGARSAGWAVEVAVIGRDVNILEEQQTRLRKRVTIPDMMNALNTEFNDLPVHYISHELVFLYKQHYLKNLSRMLDFPIAYDSIEVDNILKDNANAKYIHYVENTQLDQLVTACLASTAQPGTEWYNRAKQD